VTGPHATPRRRLAAVGLLFALPWTALLIDYSGTTVVNGLFPLFVLDYNPGVDPAVRLIPVWRFFTAGGAIPRNPELWPASILLHLVALASAAAGVLFGREDARVTGGALALAGIAGLGVAFAFTHRLRYTPIPVGALLACALAWWYYVPAFRRMFER
jgi:uncharacterized protein (TIGR04206 family)